MLRDITAALWLAAASLYERLTGPRVVLHGEPTVILDDVDPDDLRRGYSVEALRSVTS